MGGEGKEGRNTGSRTVLTAIPEVLVLHWIYFGSQK